MARAVTLVVVALAVVLAPQLAAAGEAAAAKNNAKNAAVAANNNATAAAAPAPAASEDAPTTLLGAISTRSDLTTFTAVLGLIGVDDELDQQNASTTVFAPTNAALDAFARSVLGNATARGIDLLGDRYFTLLRRVVAGVSGGRINGTDDMYWMYGGQEVRLAPKEDEEAAVAAAAPALVATMKTPGGGEVQAAAVVSADGAIDLGANGAVYVVDKVLRPADVVLVAAAAAAAGAAAGAGAAEAPTSSGARATDKASSSPSAGGASNVTATTAAMNTTAMNTTTTGAAALLAADPDLSSFARLAALLAPELLSASASAPLTLFAPRDAAWNAYLSRAHGLKSVWSAAKAIESLPEAAKAVEATAGAAQAALRALDAEKAAAAVVDALAGPAVAAAAARNAAAAADAEAAQRQLQRLLALRANLTAAVAYHVSPGLALDAATLLEGGRLLPTLLAEGPAPPAAALAVAAAVTEVAAAVADTPADADALVAAAPVVRSADVPAKMLAAKAGGNGLGAPLLLGDLGSSAAIVASFFSGDDALHMLDAVLEPSPLAGTPAPEPGTVVQGGGGDVAVPSADGMTTDAMAMPPAVVVMAPATTSPSTNSSSSSNSTAAAAAAARGGRFDVSVRNSMIQNAMQANIVRAMTGGMTVHQAAIRNNYIANLAPYNTPLYYLTPRGYGGYGGGYGGGYWMG